MPRVTPLYYHYSNELSICDAFDNTHVQYINDTLHIIRSVFKPQFIHYTKYTKYAFLLLSSIHVHTVHFVYQIKRCIGNCKWKWNLMVLDVRAGPFPAILGKGPWLELGKICGILGHIFQKCKLLNKIYYYSANEE